MNNIESIANMKIGSGIDVEPEYESKIITHPNNWLKRSQTGVDRLTMGIKLKEARKAKNLSMRALAASTIRNLPYISPTTISRAENGHTTNIITYMALARALGLKLTIVPTTT